jgi:hypothetical protein
VLNSNQDDAVRRAASLFLSSFPNQWQYGRRPIERGLRKLMEQERLTEERVSHRIRAWRKHRKDMAVWELARPASTPPRDVAIPPGSWAPVRTTPEEDQERARRMAELITRIDRERDRARSAPSPAIEESDALAETRRAYLAAVSPITSTKEKEGLPAGHGMDKPPVAEVWR